MKDMRPSSAPRRHPGFVCGFVFCLILAACLAANDVDLQATGTVWGKCGQNVSLVCNATSSQLWNMEIRKFVWEFGNKTMCQYEQKHAEPGFECESSNNTFRRAITLSLQNIDPTDEGTYLCKLHTTSGQWNKMSQLRIQDCLENSTTFRNDTYAKCSFHGVYPRGVVHWFQGDANLTEDISTQETRDERDRFTIWSSIKLKEGNQSTPLNCSLWVPSLSKHLTTRTLVNSTTRTLNSGCLIKLQWICVVVMAMVSFVM